MQGEDIVLKKSIRKDIDIVLNELKINLENNYKDLAHQALDRLHKIIDEYHDSDMMSDKDYLKYKRIANDYSLKMKDYHH